MENKPLEQLVEFMQLNNIDMLSTQQEIKHGEDRYIVETNVNYVEDEE